MGTVASGCADRSGGVAGGQIGYRWQTNQFVFGLEAQGDWADIKNTRVSLFDPTLSTTGIGLVSADNTRWGGTLGVGFEYGFTPNWSLGVEYDHLWMGHANNSFSVVDPRLAAVLNDRISQDVDMVTVRLNYRFGGFGGYGAPVAARY